MSQRLLRSAAVAVLAAAVLAGCGSGASSTSSNGIPGQSAGQIVTSTKQAIQNANLALGFDETAGLSANGVAP